jgi:hypothetical protein
LAASEAYGCRDCSGPLIPRQWHGIVPADGGPTFYICTSCWDALATAKEAVARVRSYCQDAIAIFAREGIDSPPAVGVADVLTMLGPALDG